jgi:hypothetical protein
MNSTPATRQPPTWQKVLGLSLLGVLLFARPLPADDARHKITAVDRGRIQIDSKQWLELAGIETSHLVSKKKSPTVFNDEINRFLKGYIGKDVTIEHDNALPPARQDKWVYVYYLQQAGEVNVGAPGGPGARPVMMISQVRNVNGQLQAEMTPQLQIMINMELLKKGYARVDKSVNGRYKKDFLMTEKEAQLDGNGIWA